MNVRFTRSALRDIQRIHSYIGKESPQAAFRVVARLTELANMLADNPQEGRATDDPNTRVVVVPSLRYFIFYRLAGDEIQIMHIRHTSRSRPPGWGR
jgi:toxin ParE1/3/4